MAKEFNIPTSSYANWENGKEPKYETLMKLADHFKISVDELIGYKDPSPEEKAERDFQLVKSYVEKAGYAIKNDAPPPFIPRSDIIFLYPKGNEGSGFVIDRGHFLSFALDVIADGEELKEKSIIERIGLMCKGNINQFMGNAGLGRAVKLIKDGKISNDVAEQGSAETKAPPKKRGENIR
jgi:transcriptional regulator with XRE-family HTH domain